MSDVSSNVSAPSDLETLLRHSLLLDAALWHASQGRYVFPVARDSKKPITDHGFLDATIDPDQITRWWTDHPDANVGVACRMSGLLVVDVDPDKGGDATFAALESELGALPRNVHQRSGSGGQHVVMRDPSPGDQGWTRNHDAGGSCKGDLGKGVDVKNNGYILVEPSRSPKGPYTWLASDWANVPEVPEAWQGRLKKAAAELAGGGVAAWETPTGELSEADKERLVTVLADCKRGQGHKQTFRAIKTIFHDYGRGLDEEGAFYVELWNDYYSGEPFSESDLQRQIERIASQKHEHPRGFAVGAAAKVARLVSKSAVDTRELQAKIDALKVTIATKDEEIRQARQAKKSAAEIAQITVERDNAKEALAESKEELAEAEAEDDGDADDLFDYPKMAEQYADATKHAGELTLLRQKKEWLAFDVARNAYGKTSDEQVIANLRNFFQIKRATPAKEVHEALKAIPGVLNENAELGSWLRPDGSEPNMLETVVMPNGFLDLASGTLSAPSPRYFDDHTLDVRFDASAPMPNLWLHFLSEVFEIPGQPGVVDQEQIDALQEWFGLNLVPDTKYQKAAFLYGLTRAGKGTIQRVLAALLGIRSICSPKLRQLADPFGLTSMVGKLSAIIGDVRLSKNDVEMIVEVLLATTGEDFQEVNRKFVKDNLITKLSARMTIAANGYPEFADASGSIAARMLIFVFKNSFAHRQDPKLLEKLKAELPGILNWAIEGWRRLKARGHFVQPKSGEEALKEFARSTSPAKAWADDCCETTTNPDEEMETKAAYNSFRQWWRDQGKDLDAIPKDNVFGKQLSEAKGTTSDRRRLLDPSTGKKSQRGRVYRGLKLKPVPGSDEGSARDKGPANEGNPDFRKAERENNSVNAVASPGVPGVPGFVPGKVLSERLRKS